MGQPRNTKEKMKNKKFEELALATGGSHYPNVGGDLLEQFGRMVVEECIEAVKNTPKQCAFTTRDVDIVECTVEKAIEEIQKRFKGE